MNSVLISIVIPMYNVEKYIERCIVSCQKQDIGEDFFEIIVINDGSTDRSLLIANELARNNKSIRVVNQNNKGLSGARNTGLLEARGEYIWFVDSDDWIEENSLANVCSQCEGIDVLCLSYRKVFEGNKTEKIVCPPIPDSLNGRSLFNTKSFCTPAQFYVFRKEFLLENDLRFYEGIYHEDMEFTPRMLYLARKIKVYEVPVYNYYIRSNSITTTVNPKRSFDLLKVARSLSNFSSNVKNIEARRTFDYYISICLNNALYYTSGYTKDKIKEFAKTFSKNKDLFRHLSKSRLMKNKLEGLFFTLFPSKSVEIYHLISKFK